MGVYDHADRYRAAEHLTGQDPRRDRLAAAREIAPDLARAILAFHAAHGGQAATWREAVAVLAPEVAGYEGWATTRAGLARTAAYEEWRAAERVLAAAGLLTRTAPETITDAGRDRLAELEATPPEPGRDAGLSSWSRLRGLCTNT